MGFIGKFAESGGLEDLSKAPYNAGAQISKIAKFAVPAATNSKGALAALPVDIGPGALFYRTDLLQKAGVTEGEMTKSWEGFIAAGKKVKASTGAYMLANATDIKDIYIRAGLKDGEGIYFDKAGKSLVASERFERAFDLTRQARQAGIDAKVSAWTNEWSEGFRRDKIAAQMMGAWLSGHLKNWIVPNTSGKWRSAQLPAGAFAAYGGSFYAVPAKAANKQAAWNFVQYLTLNKEQQLEAFRNMDAFPSLVEAQTDAFTDQPIEFLAGQKARQLWKAAADRIPAVAVDRYDAVAAEIVGAELDKVLEQGKDIKQALADAKSGIERRVRRK
jgi:multiple sugar transport system substrate-binding protein